MARGLMKNHPSPAELRERMDVQAGLRPSAREVFEVRTRARRAASTAAALREGVRS